MPVTTAMHESQPFRHRVTCTGKGTRSCAHSIRAERHAPRSATVTVGCCRRDTGNQRKRIFRRRRQQRHVLRVHHANQTYRVSALAQFAAARIKPLDLDGVSPGNCFQRPEPTGAMACQYQVSRLSQTGAVEHVRRTESQGARSCAFQNNLIVAQTRDFQARYQVRIRPWPRRGTAGIWASGELCLARRSPKRMTGGRRLIPFLRGFFFQHDRPGEQDVVFQMDVLVQVGFKLL